MGVTTTYGLRYPELTDAPNGPTGIKNLADDAEAALKKPCFSAIQTAAQSLPNNAYTPITFTAEQIDTHNGHSTSSNTSRYVIPAGWSGIWRVSGAVLVVGTGGRRAAAIAKNGTLQPGLQIVPAVATGDTSATTAPKLFNAVAGDYFELWGYQDSGAAKNTGSDFAGGFVCCLDVEFVRR